MGKKWEYQKIEFIGGQTEDILAQLNAAGAEGWELTGTNAMAISGVNKETGAKVDGMLFVYWLKREPALIQVPGKVIV